MTVFYRRTRGEMPAYAEEIEAALEEGIKIETLVAPVGGQVQERQAHGHRVPAQRTGRAGRQRPRQAGAASRAASSSVELDTLVVAISEEPEPETLDGPQDQPLGLPGRSTRNRTSPASRACSAAATW